MEEVTMTAANTRPPSSLCPTCRIRPRCSVRSGCKECERERWRRRKTRPKRCEKCGQRLPHPGTNGCPVVVQQRRIRQGREHINRQWPGYADLLTDEALLARAGHDWPHVAGFPRPSRLFVGLDPSLDQRLIKDQRDKDVVLCQALAKLPAADQREFLELYLMDPIDAAHWASLPRWKRPIRKGDPDDLRIWKFFVMQQLNMEQAAADAAPWAMASQGAQLPQMFGAIDRLSLDGLRKLCLVMSAFGWALQHGHAVGNTSKKPWEEKDLR